MRGFLHTPIVAPRVRTRHTQLHGGAGGGRRQALPVCHSARPSESSGPRGRGHPCRGPPPAADPPCRGPPCRRPPLPPTRPPPALTPPGGAAPNGSAERGAGQTKAVREGRVGVCVSLPPFPSAENELARLRAPLAEPARHAPPARARSGGAAPPLGRAQERCPRGGAPRPLATGTRNRIYRAEP